MRIIKKRGNKLLYKELRKSYNFFIKEANTNKKSKGYGLIRDKTILSDNVASIASVGYGLAALVIGVEHKWISYKKAYDRTNQTLDTFINNVDGKNGFYYHFVNMKTGKKEWNCEISIIDTAIFICGALVAGEYFGKSIENDIIGAVVWAICTVTIYLSLKNKKLDYEFSIMKDRKFGDNEDVIDVDFTEIQDENSNK